MSQLTPTDVEANAYAENYILYGDQTRAFRVAFPDNKAAPETQHAKASAFHKLDKVRVRIEELRKILKKQSEVEFTLSVSEIKQLLATAVKKGLTDKKDILGNKIAVSVSGAVAALNEFNKMDGNHAPTKNAHGGSHDMPPIRTLNATLTEEQALALLAKNGLK